MKKATIIIKPNNEIQDYLSLLFLFRSTIDNYSIVLINPNDKHIEFIEKICVLGKRNNTQIFIVDKKEDDGKFIFSSSLNDVDISLYRGNLNYENIESSLNEHILCFASLNYLLPYAEFINKKKSHIIYLSKYPYINNRNNISDRLIKKYDLYKDDEYIDIFAFSNLLLLPNNISYQLTFNEEYYQLLVKSNNRLAMIIKTLFDLTNNYSHDLKHLIIPLVYIFEENFDIYSRRIKQEKSYYVDDVNQKEIHLALHAHKIEMMMKLVFERFIENKYNDNNVISLNIENRYILTKFLSLHSSSLHVDEIGWEKRLPSSSFGPIKRNYYIIHFVINGKGIFKTADKVYKIQKGDSFLVTPHHSCFYEADEVDPCEYYWIGVSGQGVTDLFSDAGFIKSNVYSKNIKSLNSVIEKMRYLVSLDISTPNLDLLINGYFYLIMFDIISKSREIKYQKDIVFDVKEYIDLHYQEPITVSSIAKVFNYDRTYLFRKFKEKMNMSIIEYITSLRFKKIVQLIKEDVLIQQIPYLTGFNDYQSFYAFFKKRTGLTPHQYKKQQNNISRQQKYR